MEKPMAGVWDRLISGLDCPSEWTLQRLTAAIKRDLEALLNTRTATGPFPEHPHCERSILNFGLPDFAHLSLGSDDDQKAICGLIRATIRQHEPRLDKVHVTLSKASSPVNQLSFVVSGQLRLQGPAREVQIGIALEPSSMRYTVEKSGSAR
ncbi:MAG: type VI secretion system baseplate subunit TssE [Telluria sp.]